MTASDVESLRDEVLKIASELTKGAQLLSNSGKSGVSLYGVVEARKGLQNARNVAATVIGQASVGDSLVPDKKPPIKKSAASRSSGRKRRESEAYDAIKKEDKATKKGG